MKLFLLMALVSQNMILLGSEAQSQVVTPQLQTAITSPHIPSNPQTAQTLSSNLSQAKSTQTNETKVLVAEVVVKTPSGQPLPPDIAKKVYEIISTKSGIAITHTQLQADINTIFEMGFFSKVQAEPEDTKNGVRVNFVVILNPVLKAVNTQGTKILEPSVIARIFASQIGKVTNIKTIQAGVKTLAKYYEDLGYVLSQVVDIKAQPDGIVTLIISEGEIEDIKVAYLYKDGNSVVRNTPDALIMEQVSLKKGDIFSKPKAQSDLEKVFKLGLFDDIQLGLALGRDPRKAIVTIKVKDRSLSKAHFKLNDYPKAIKYYEQSLMIARKIKDRKNEANILTNLGFAHIKIEEEKHKDYPKAIAYFEQALTIVRELEDRKDEMDILRALGFGYNQWQDYPKAITHYNQALTIAQELKDKDVEWRALVNLAEVYKNQTDYLKAISYCEQALKVVRELKDRNGEAHALIVLSSVYLPLSDYSSMIAYAEKALAVTREIKNPEKAREKASLALAILLLGYSSLGNRPNMLVYSDKLWEIFQRDDNLRKKDSLGFLSSFTKEDFQEGLLPLLSLFLSFNAITPSISTDGYEAYTVSASFSSKKGFRFATEGKVLDPKAIAYFEQSLATARLSKDRNRETFALLVLTLGYYLQDDYPKAIKTLEQSLKNVQELKIPLLRATVFGAQGYLYNSQGDYPKAITSLEQALKIMRELKAPIYEAVALGILGYVYNSQGDYPKAIALGEQSLKIMRELDNTNFEVIASSAMISAYNSQGDYPKAIALGEQLLKIGAKYPTYNALVLGIVGATYSKKGDHPKAISYYEQALALPQNLKDQEVEAAFLGKLAVEYAQIGDSREIAYLEQALAIYRQQAPREREKALRELGELYANQGKYPQALSLFQESVSVLRETGDRAAVSKALIELGDLFIKQKYPDLAILHYKQAINAIESIRGDVRQIGKQQQRSYVGKVERTYRNLADLLLQQGRVTEALQVLDLLKVQEIEDYFKTFSRTEATAKGIPLLPAEQSAIGTRLSQDQLASLNQQLATALKQEIATERERIPDTLKQLPKGAALLYPVLLDDRLELVLFIPGQPPIRRSVAVKPDQITKVIRELRVYIQDPRYLDVMDPSQKLYDWLLRPLAPDLDKSNITTILYAPDKQLRYVPLTALHDGKQWVIERYEVGYLIAYNLADFRGDVPKKPSILVGALGKNSYPGLPPLPATLTEVESITTSISETLKFVQDSFTRQSIQQNLQGRTILHLATHAEFRGDSPDDSFILMGNGDKLTLTDLREWRLPGVDLVVLSACQTGLGKADRGIEILGFGYQMQLVGAKGTLSSLWSVSDGSTGILMDAFYQQFAKTPNSFAALRNAQLTMIRQGNSLTGESKLRYETLRTGLPPELQGSLSHPYYWAAFVAIQNSFPNTQVTNSGR